MIIEKLDKYVIKILECSGWKKDRKVNTDEWIELLTEEGYILNNFATEVLQELGNINIRTKGDAEHYGISVYFNPIYAASGEYDRLEIFNTISGDELFPIGECFDWIIYVGRNGIIYLGDWKSLSIAGQSIEEFLNTIVNPQSKLEEIYVNNE